MRKKKATKVINIRCTENFKEQLQTIAKWKKVSVTDLIVVAVMKQFGIQEKEEISL